LLRVGPFRVTLLASLRVILLARHTGPGGWSMLRGMGACSKFGLGPMQGGLLFFYLRFIKQDCDWRAFRHAT